MDTIEAAAPVTTPPPPARLPAFHRGMRRIVLLNVLGSLLILPVGMYGGPLWFLLFCATVVVLIWTLYATLRSDQSKVFPGIALALAIYFCAQALYIDFNPFIPNNPSPRNYEGTPTAWAAWKMISILLVVWAFHIWDDFAGVFRWIRAALAVFCAVALFLFSQTGLSLDAGMRSYDPSPTSSNPATGDPSIPLQTMRRSQDSLAFAALFSLIVLAAISWWPRWRPK